MGNNPTVNEIQRVGTTNVSVTAGGTTTADIDIPQGEAVLLSWGHDSNSGDASTVEVRLVQDNDNDRQQVEVSEQGGNNTGQITLTVYSPR